MHCLQTVRSSDIREPVDGRSLPPPASTLAAPCLDGVYLPRQENEFVHLVADELEAFGRRSERKSVLLFPPLPSRLRYLIHKTTEELPELASFSVGESWCRRVVVCHADLRGEVQEDSDLESNASSSEKPQRSREETEGNAKPRSSAPPGSRGPKRPDKALYMPRAARERLHLLNSRAPSGEPEPPSPAPGGCGCAGGISDSCGEAAEKAPCGSPPRGGGEGGRVDDSPPLCPEEDKQNVVLRLHEAEPAAWEENICGLGDLTLEDEEEAAKEEEEEEEEADAAGVTGDADLAEEIKAHLKEAAAVSIEHAHNDYSGYENVAANPDEFRHVIEIYDFPPVFKTDDLLGAFADYSDGGMKIKWVDNTHALGVFSSESAALHALSICHPLLRVRALAKGSKKAKGKAVRRAEFIQPVKERPRTDCAVARRMVTRALGLQGRGRVPRY